MSKPHVKQHSTAFKVVGWAHSVDKFFIVVEQMVTIGKN